MSKSLNKDYDIQEELLSKSRRRWICIVYMLTFLVPSFLLRWRCCGGMTSDTVRMAWREKLALNMIIWASCGMMLFYIIGLGRILCPVVRVLSQGEVDGLNTLKNPFVVVYGDYYKINEVVKVLEFLLFDLQLE